MMCPLVVFVIVGSYLTLVFLMDDGLFVSWLVACKRFLLILL